MTVEDLIKRAKKIKGVTNIKELSLPIKIYSKVYDTILEKKKGKAISFSYKNKHLGAILNPSPAQIMISIIVKKKEDWRYLEPPLLGIGREILFQFNIKNIEDVKEITKDIRNTAKKLPKKKMTLESFMNEVL